MSVPDENRTVAVLCCAEKSHGAPTEWSGAQEADQGKTSGSSQLFGSPEHSLGRRAYHEQVVQLHAIPSRRVDLRQGIDDSNAGLLTDVSDAGQAQLNAS